MRIDNFVPVQTNVQQENGSNGRVVGSNSTEKIGKNNGVVNNPKANFDALKNIYTDKELKKIGVIECETCANRTYVDGSDDPGVSFKTPGKIAPEISASVVMSHELEHVSNEQASAEAEGREVVSQSVSLHASICPECGISYVAGGETRTVTKGKDDYGSSKELFKGLKIDQKL